MADEAAARTVATTDEVRHVIEEKGANHVTIRGDILADEALGDNIKKGYYRSSEFLFSVTVCDALRESN